MKLAVWKTVIGSTLLLTANALCAAQPEVLQEPKGLSSSILHQPESMPGKSTDSMSDKSSDNWTESISGDQTKIFDDHQSNWGEPECDEPAFPYTSGTWWRNGCWYGDFDLVVWDRSRPFSRILGLDASAVGIIFKNTLNKHGNSLPLEPGGRGTIGYILDRDIDNRDHSLEVTYMGFNNWEGTDGLISQTPRDLRVPESPNYGGFNFADVYNTFYRSSLQTFEVDYRIRNRPGRDRMILGPDGFWSRQLSPGRTQSLILGFRVITEQERWRWISLRNGVSPDVFSGDYQVNTKNWLFGPQFGGDCMDLHEHWYWGLKGDAGVYCNFADGFGRIAVNDDQNPEPLVQHHATSQNAAFYGELSFMAGYEITDHFMIHAGIDMGLLTGLAVAPDQVSFKTYLADTQPFLNTGSQIFYSGLSLGVEAYW